MRDSIAAAYFAETDGRSYIPVPTHIRKGYAPWEAPPGLPYGFILEKSDPHHYNVMIDEQPGLPHLRVGLSTIKGCVEQPAHAVEFSSPAAPA